MSAAVRDCSTASILPFPPAPPPPPLPLVHLCAFPAATKGLVLQPQLRRRWRHATCPGSLLGSGRWRQARKGRAERPGVSSGSVEGGMHGGTDGRQQHTRPQVGWPHQQTAVLDSCQRSQLPSTQARYIATWGGATAQPSTAAIDQTANPLMDSSASNHQPVFQTSTDTTHRPEAAAAVALDQLAQGHPRLRALQRRLHGRCRHCGGRGERGENHSSVFVQHIAMLCAVQETAAARAWANNGQGGFRTPGDPRNSNTPEHAYSQHAHASTARAACWMPFPHSWSARGHCCVWADHGKAGQ